MAKLESLKEYVTYQIQQNRFTHAELSKELQKVYPDERGFSVRSVERFCSREHITKISQIDDRTLDGVVSEAVMKVGPTYGRKTMTGLLTSQGINVSQERVRRSLCRVNPVYHFMRSTRTERHTNPIPYHADYFGHKLHVDQNEKLVMYGATHICAIDGYSGMIVGFITTPIKNNVEIYTHLYRPILMQYGLWDQLRVDHGKEWTLMLFAQEQLAHMRRNQSRSPHVQTTSKLNHCIERIWVEVNARVNYPIKASLVAIEESGEINMDNPYHRYCVSWFTIGVANVGTTLVVQAWNNHPRSAPHHGTRAKGIPNIMMRRNNQTVMINHQLIKDPTTVLEEYRQLGGNITVFSPFGEDPLKNHPDLVAIREKSFFERYTGFEQFFYNVVNGDFSLFKEGLLFFIDVTIRLGS